MLKSFGVTVKQARMQRGMTQGQVAEIVGASQVTISKIESGKCGKIPPLLCTLLGVDPPKRATPAHLLAFRKAFRLTAKKAASLVGVSAQTWAYWEGGGALRGIPYHVLPKLQHLAAELRKENEPC